MQHSRHTWKAGLPEGASVTGADVMRAERWR